VAKKCYNPLRTTREQQYEEPGFCNSRSRLRPGKSQHSESSFRVWRDTVFLQYESLAGVYGISVDGLGKIKIKVPTECAEDAKQILEQTHCDLNRTSLNFLVEHYVNNCFPTSCKGWYGSGALISPRERFWVLLSGISSILFSQFTIISGVFGSILKFLQGLFLTKYDTGPFFNVFPRLIAFFVSLLAIIFTICVNIIYLIIDKCLRRKYSEHFGLRRELSFQ